MEDGSTAGSNSVAEPIVWPNESQEYAQYMRDAQNRCCVCKFASRFIVFCLHWEQTCEQFIECSSQIRRYCKLFI